MSLAFKAELCQPHHSHLIPGNDDRYKVRKSTVRNRANYENDVDVNMIVAEVGTINLRGADNMFKKILAPIDLDHASVNERIFSIAEEMANLHNAELHVITVVPTYSMSIVGSFFPKEHEKQVLEAAQTALKDVFAKRTSANCRTQRPRCSWHHL